MGSNADPNRFTSKTRNQLALQAANHCTNPKCRKPTSYASDDMNEGLSIGVAAHICGANEGSARYDDAMKSWERAHISNGVWLCQSCSRIIDVEPRYFTKEVLHSWKIQHLSEIRNRVVANSYVASVVREKQTWYSTNTGGAMSVQTESTGDLPSFDDSETLRIRQIEDVFPERLVVARSIAIQAEEYWEHMLLAELWRDLTRQSRARLEDDVNRVVFVEATGSDSHIEYLHWTAQYLADLTQIITVVPNILSKKVMPSLGEPGEPGDAIAMYHAVTYLSDVYNRMTAMIVESRHRIVPDSVTEYQKAFTDIVLGPLETFDSFPDRIEEVVEVHRKTGESENLNITLALDDATLDTILVAIEEAKRKAGLPE